jgi:hypothetical protein
MAVGARSTEFRNETDNFTLAEHKLALSGPSSTTSFLDHVKEPAREFANPVSITPFNRVGLDQIAANAYGNGSGEDEIGSGVLIDSA